MKWFAVGVSSIGYALAIAGGVLLYRNASPDLGETGLFASPGWYEAMWLVPKDDEDAERAGISRRHRRSRLGFLLVTVGAGLQWAGTVAAALA